VRCPSSCPVSLGSALILARLRLPHPPSSLSQEESWPRQVREGLALLSGDRLLRGLVIGQFLAAISAGATSALLVVLAREQLGRDPAGYGMMLAAIGIGAALGPLILPRLVTSPRRPAFVFGPYLLRALVDLVLAATRTPALALAALQWVYLLGAATLIAAAAAGYHGLQRGRK
jgi:predicted MFS family arabinose efflux permease